MSSKKDEIAASAHLPALNPSAVPAFPGLTVVGDKDAVLSQPFEFTMTDDWLGYGNLRILEAVVEFYGSKLNFMKFIPDPLAQEVIILAAKDEDEYGAQPVKYVETENGFYVSLRLPLQHLKVNRLVERVRIFPVKTRVGADGKTYLAFSVKESTNRPVVKRKQPAKAKKPEGNGPEKSSPGASGTTEQPQTENK